MLALGTFQHSGSKGGGPATKKGRKERGRVEIYTKGGGSKATPSIPKLSPQYRRSYVPQRPRVLSPRGGARSIPGTSDKHFRFLSAHIIFIS